MCNNKGSRIHFPATNRRFRGRVCSRDIQTGGQTELKTKKSKKKIAPWLFSGPALLAYTSVVIVPIICSLGFSFYDYSGVGKRVFNGINNYVRMFRDDTFLIAIKNNLLLMAGSTAIQMVLGLVLAILLSNIRKFTNVLRVAYFVPCIISSAAICQIFSKMFSIVPEGVIPALMRLGGMEQIAFLSDSKWALAIVIILDAYKYVSMHMIIFYSALMDVDESVVEAAIVDGCGWWKLHTKIKIPMIMNIIVMELVLLINGTLKAFDISYILTKGGPGTTTELVVTYMYKTSFGMAKFGVGSAMAVFLAVESLAAVGIVRYIGNKLQQRYT